MPDASPTRPLPSTPFRLVQGDLTDEQADAIVNAANSSLLGGGGVDGAIHRRGGPEILAACKALRRDFYPEGLPTGEAVLTTAGRLPAHYVIHTVGPVWQGGAAGEADLLARAYRNVLKQAEQHGLRTVAFPSISTGVYGYPIEQAAPVALGAAATYVKAAPKAFDELRFVLFSARDFAVYREALAALDIE